MLYPLTFRPILKERVWGGRNLEGLYHKKLPLGVPIGESWEVADRPEDVSIIDNGPLAEKDLHWLMREHRVDLLGQVKPAAGRFPLLIKILDAQDVLSLQVHPPARIAAQLGGEPKTELWYIAHAKPDARLFVGLKRGTDRGRFETKLGDGTVADCFHQVQVRQGDAMFLPSGRVHAIGGGLVIFEIQQNSDTTYRVFDWNRVGLDGRPRQLHLAQSLASIDFSDIEPPLVDESFLKSGPAQVRQLVSDPLFVVDLVRLAAAASLPLTTGTMQIVGVVDGALSIHSGATTVSLAPGQFCLLPACLQQALAQAPGPASFLRIEAGR